MTHTPETRNPGWRAGAPGSASGRQSFHVQNATAEPLLQRLEGVQKAGKGWRARCPACGGQSRKLSIAEAAGRVLIHCFGCNDTSAVLAAVGLSFADILPPRHWPESPQERRELSRIAREGALVAALPELAHATAVVRLAAASLLRDEALDWNDYCTLVKAEEVIGNARTFFCEPTKFRQVGVRP